MYLHSPVFSKNDEVKGMERKLGYFGVADFYTVNRCRSYAA